MLDSAQHTTLTGGREQDRSTLTTGTTGTADTVHVSFGVVWNIVVNNMADTLNVQTTGGYVGGDQNVEGAFFQAINHLLTQGLAHITIQGSR